MFTILTEHMSSLFGHWNECGGPSGCMNLMSSVFFPITTLIHDFPRCASNVAVQGNLNVSTVSLVLNATLRYVCQRPY
jgi:hypothetical protein